LVSKIKQTYLIDNRCLILALVHTLLMFNINVNINIRVGTVTSKLSL